MVQRKHKRPGFSPNRAGNVECFSVNTSGAAFPEIDQANVEWFSVNTSGVPFLKIDQSHVNWFSVNTIGLALRSGAETTKNGTAKSELEQQSVNWNSGQHDVYFVKFWRQTLRRTLPSVCIIQ